MKAEHTLQLVTPNGTSEQVLLKGKENEQHITAGSIHNVTNADHDPEKNATNFSHGSHHDTP